MYRRSFLSCNKEILNNALNGILNNTNNLLIESKVHLIFSSLEASLLALSFRLEDITNAIVLSNQNILHPSVLSPSQLYKELIDNDRHLPRDAGIPIALSINNIHVILSISDVSCYFLNNKIVFVLQIPLTTDEEFNLYHSIALPTPHNSTNPNIYSLILPSTPYIGISNDKLSYCNFDSLNNCKSIRSEFLLCKIQSISLTNGNPICESELLTKTFSAIPTQCKTKTLFSEMDIWKPLVNNRWIFVQSRPNKITIDCGISGLREPIILGTGILNIPTQCTVYTKSTRLVSSENTLNINIPTPSLDFNIINDSCCKLNVSYTRNIKEYTSPILLQNLDLDHFTSNKQNLEIFTKLNNIINKPLAVKYGTHHITITSVLLILIIIFLTFKLYQFVRNKIKNKFNINVTTPARNDDENLSTSQHENSQIPAPRLREIA